MEICRCITVTILQLFMPLSRWNNDTFNPPPYLQYLRSNWLWYAINPDNLPISNIRLPNTYPYHLSANIFPLFSFGSRIICYPYFASDFNSHKTNIVYMYHITNSDLSIISAKPAPYKSNNGGNNVNFFHFQLLKLQNTSFLLILECYLTPLECRHFHFLIYLL